MRVKDLSEEKKEFEPIRLEITFETEEEAVEFWHRMNASASLYGLYGQTERMRKGIKEGRLIYTGMARNCWKAIDYAIKKQDIKI